jgi:excisionase family DNA binding protein
VKNNYSTHDIAEIFGVTPRTVANWIDAGELAAYLTPGRHRRVLRRELKNFLLRQKMEIPPELNDKKYRPAILVVDDDRRLAGTLKRMLEKEFSKYEIMTAADGYRAAEIIFDWEPQLVIMDIIMPGIDGCEVCARIKKRNPAIKVIAVSGYSTAENREKMAKAGSDAFLAKPFRKRELIDEVTDLLKADRHGEKNVV